MPESSDLESLREAIAEYALRQGIRNYGLSDPYNLHKEWNSTSFPHASSPGCYFIFGHDGALLYIGKASLGSTVGKRLSTYFCWTGDRLTNRQSGWAESEPTWVRTLPVEEPYQAASLEEYLIDRLKPEYNTRK